MTRAASVLLRVLGLALVLTGVMGFALLGADGTWTARTEVPAGRTAVLVEPSLASVLGPTVTVRVELQDEKSTVSGEPQKLFLGRGRSDDLTAYARDPEVARVVGVDDSRRLRLEPGPGPASGLDRDGVLGTTSGAVSGAVSGDGPTTQAPSSTAAPVAGEWPAPTTVDLWQQQESGPDARELSWRPTSGARSILVAHEDGSPLPALDLEVAWTDHTWLWIPSVVLLLGLLLLGGGLVLSGVLPVSALRSLAGSLTQPAARVRGRSVAPAARRRETEPSPSAPERDGSGGGLTAPVAHPARPDSADADAVDAADAGDADAARARDGEAVLSRVPEVVGSRQAGHQVSSAAPPVSAPGAEPTIDRLAKRPAVGQPATTVTPADAATPVGAELAADRASSPTVTSRRAARGRRRKPTTWQRLRSRAATTVTGRRSRRSLASETPAQAADPGEKPS